MRDRTSRGKVADRGTIARQALALNARSRGHVWELRGNLNSSGGPGLLQMCGGNFDGLVGVERLFFQRVQFVIAKGTPPFAFGKTIFWSALAPGFRDVPFCGHRRRGAPVIRPHGAAAEDGTNSKPGQGGESPGALHYCFLAPGAGLACGAGWPGAWLTVISLTWTSWPSSRESAGFSTIQSAGSSPCRTSRVVP